MASGSKNGYLNLWPSVSAAELQHAKRLHLFDTPSAAPPRDTADNFYRFIDLYAAQHATQALTNLLPLLSDFAAGRVEIKSMSRANRYRTAGNAAFGERCYQRAAGEYRRALLYVKEGEAAMIYGNLSACYMHLREYRACIEGMLGAVNAAGYPEGRLAVKFTLRATRCLHEMQPLVANAGGDGEKNLTDLITDWSQQTANQKPATSSALRQLLTSALALLPSSSAPPSTTPPLPELRYPPTTTTTTTTNDGDKPPADDNFSSGFTQHESPECGRFILASRAFEAGDVVLVERPFASVVLKPHRHSVCYGCLAPLTGSGSPPLACPGCAAVLFCSRVCREEGWTRFHRYECRFMFLLDCVGVGHLAARLLLLDGKPGYGRVEALVHHFQDFPTEDLFEYGLTAWLITHILNTAGWQTSSSTSQAAGGKSAATSIGGRCLLHLLRLQCNAHAITTVMPEEEMQDETAGEDDLTSSPVEAINQTRVGTALYPSASLLNHDCQPGVVNCFHGDWLVLRATRPLVPGDQLVNCYGPHYLRQAWRAREAGLRGQYFFHCRCRHCVARDTTGGGGLVEALTGLLCPLCSRSAAAAAAGCLDDAGRCSQCSRRTPLAPLRAQLKQSENEPDPLKVVEVQTRLLHPDNRQLAGSLDSAAHWLARTGQWASACRFAERGLARTRRVFGPYSPEVGWEAVKLAGLLHRCRDGGEEGAGEEGAWREALAALGRNYGADMAAGIVAGERRRLEAAG